MNPQRTETRKLKVAICFAGEPRDFKYGFADLISKLNLHGVEADFYIHCWFGEGGLSNLPLHNQRQGLRYQEILDTVSSAEFVYRIKPKSFLVEDYYSSRVHEKFSFPGSEKLSSTITRMHSMFYSIQACLSLVKRQSYDLIVRTRPDLFFDKRICWSEVSDLMERQGPSVIFPSLWINVDAYSEPWSPNGDYYPDFFWIFHPQVEVFQSIYSDIEKYCSMHVDLTRVVPGDWASVPENYLARYLKLKKCRVFKLNQKVMLLRHHRQLVSKKPIL